QTQREECGRQLSRDSDETPGERLTRIARRRTLGHDARAVALADARAVREQGVAIGEVRKGVQRNSCDLELAGQRAPIQALDVGELVYVAPPPRIDLARSHRPEHERIVRIRAVRDADDARQRRSAGHDGDLRGFCVWRSASAWKLVSGFLCSSYSGRLR